LADDTGMNPWLLREWLREEVERRREDRRDETPACFTSINRAAV